ncbi:hypothetical protein ACFQZC_25505 [Streptacidiphilus monticola]
MLTLAEKGRDLHLFVADGKVPGTGTKYQRYVGQMVMDRQPYEERWNVDREGALRRVYVFRMRPVDQQVVVHEQDLMPPAPRTTSLLIPATVNTATFTYAEQHSTDEATLGWQEPRVVRRREGALRTAFEERLVALGHEVGTYQLQIRGERGVFTTDLFDATDKVLFEAKSSSSRHAIREAVGQLMDYRRHISAPGLRCAVLLPERPNDDLQNFLQSVGIASVYRDGDDFAGYPWSEQATRVRTDVPALTDVIRAEGSMCGEASGTDAALVASHGHGDRHELDGRTPAARNGCARGDGVPG